MGICKSCCIFILLILLTGCGMTQENIQEKGDASNVNISNEATVNAGIQDRETEAAISEDQAEEAPEIPTEDTEATVIMVGDILLHTPVEEACRETDGGYDYSTLFTYTKEMIASADLAIVNQEVIIGGEELGISGYPAFNAP